MCVRAVLRGAARCRACARALAAAFGLHADNIRSPADKISWRQCCCGMVRSAPLSSQVVRPRRQFERARHGASRNDTAGIVVRLCLRGARACAECAAQPLRGTASARPAAPMCEAVCSGSAFTSAFTAYFWRGQQDGRCGCARREASGSPGGTLQCSPLLQIGSSSGNGHDAMMVGWMG